MKIFYVLLIGVVTFFLNLLLYYYSSEYRGFLKNIKEDNVIEQVNDDYRIENEYINDDFTEKPGDDIEEKLNQQFSIDDKTIEKVTFKQEDEHLEITESIYFIDYLKRFSDYNFIKLESHSSLMNVTEEYPDDYFEYYNKKISIYYFPTKNYNDIKEIFEIESDSNFFSINELDNFGEESFYLNLLEPYDDGFVRIILSSNDNIIGIKVSKNEYNSIKQIIK